MRMIRRMRDRPARQIYRALLLAALLALVLVQAGCGNKKVPVILEERSEFEIKLVIETQPAGAHIYSANLKSLGESPVEQIFSFEKLRTSSIP